MRRLWICLCWLMLLGSQLTVVGLDRGRTVFQTVYDFDEMPPRLSAGQSFTWEVPGPLSGI